MGLFLRDLDVQDPLCDLSWQESVLFALLSDLVPLRETESSNNRDGIDSIIQMYAAFVRRVYELGLDTLAYADPLLDVRTPKKDDARDADTVCRAKKSSSCWQSSLDSFCKFF